MTIFRGGCTGIAHLCRHLGRYANGTAVGYSDFGTVGQGQRAVGRGLGIAVLHIARGSGVLGAVTVKGSQQGHAGGNGIAARGQCATCRQNDSFVGCTGGMGNCSR